MCPTWTGQGYFQYEPSDLHSAAAEPGLSLLGTRSFGPAQSRTEPQRNLLFTRHIDNHTCMYPDQRACVCLLRWAFLSLPLSPDRRSSSLAGVSAGSSFPRPPAGYSDLAQCAGTEPKHPDTHKHKQKDKRDRGSYWWGLERERCVCVFSHTAGELTTICSSVLLLKASSKRLALSFRLWFWNVRVSTWSWTSAHTNTTTHLTSVHISVHQPNNKP